LGFSKSVFDAVSHVGVPRPNTSLSPLSLRERARVRGLLIFCIFAFDSVSHVGVFRLNTSVSPLSLRERVRVRGS
jgi:hypothetical protein